MPAQRSQVPLELGTVDLIRGVLYGPQGEVRLSVHQVELLRYLSERPGVTVSRDELLREVWRHPGSDLRTRAPDFAMHRLRALLERDPAAPRHLRTHAGQGYRFEPLADVPDPDPPVSAPGRPADEHSTFSFPATEGVRAAIAPPGTPYDPALHVPRPAAERDARDSLAGPGAPLVLAGPRGIGKSWLLERLLADLADEDRVAWVDAAAIPHRHEPRAVMLHMGLALAEAVDLDPSQVGARFDGGGDGFRALGALLQGEVLPRTPGRLLWVIDHADRLRVAAEGAAIFALLRSLAARARSPWERLRLALLVSTEPALLVEDPHLSPFNLVPPVELGPLTEADLAPLVQRCGLRGVEALVEATGGHPWLVRLALHAAVYRGQELARVLADGDVFAAHLHGRLQALRARPALLTAYQDALAGRRIDPLLAARLASVGLLDRQGRAGAGIYLRFFGSGPLGPGV